MTDYTASSLFDIFVFVNGKSCTAAIRPVFARHFTRQTQFLRPTINTEPILSDLVRSSKNIFDYLPTRYRSHCKYIYIILGNFRLVKVSNTQKWSSSLRRFYNDFAFEWLLGQQCNVIFCIRTLLTPTVSVNVVKLDNS